MLRLGRREPSVVHRLASRRAQQPFAFRGVFTSLHFQNMLKYNCSHSFMEENNLRKTYSPNKMSLKSNLPRCIYYLEVLI